MVVLQKPAVMLASKLLELGSDDAKILVQPPELRSNRRLFDRSVVEEAAR
jgi:hypothetical protein